MLRERKIAYREQRPSRILGCTYSEWGSMAVPAILMLLVQVPLVFALFAEASIVTGVLYVNRRLPYKALDDLQRQYTDILAYGARSFFPARTDVALRDGEPLFRRLPRQQSES